MSRAGPRTPTCTASSASTTHHATFVAHTEATYTASLPRYVLDVVCLGVVLTDGFLAVLVVGRHGLPALFFAGGFGLCLRPVADGFFAVRVFAGCRLPTFSPGGSGLCLTYASVSASHHEFAWRRCASTSHSGGDEG
jgi:hypothetical protein